MKGNFIGDKNIHSYKYREKKGREEALKLSYIILILGSF